MRLQGTIKQFFLLSLICFCLVFNSGCSTISYGLQIVNGHFHVLSKSDLVDELIKKPTTSDLLKQKLLLAKSAKVFAIENLKLPANSSYSRYTNLGREAVVWNVVVANEFSLELETWCFPIAGCVSYKGFYSFQDAEKFAKKKQSENKLEVAIIDVPAYSTLGWSNWLGGDPLLNTFIYGSDTYLVGLIFHELAHQKIYVKDDSSFNEAFATAVERVGVDTWLKMNRSASDLAVYKTDLQRRADFNNLLSKVSSDLRTLYKTKKLPAEMKLEKDLIMASLRKKLLSFSFVSNFEVQKKAEYIEWVSSLNNAYLGMIGLYEDLTPGFTALIMRNNYNWINFYKEVEQLSRLPKIERREILLKYASELK